MCSGRHAAGVRSAVDESKDVPSTERKLASAGGRESEPASLESGCLGSGASGSGEGDRLSEVQLMFEGVGEVGISTSG